MAESQVAQFIRSFSSGVKEELSLIFSGGESSTRYVWYLGVFSLCAACAVGGYFAYGWYTLRQQKQETAHLLSAYEAYEELQNADDVALFDDGLRRLTTLQNSTTAESFYTIGMVRVNLMIERGMHKEALDVINELAGEVDTDSPIYSVVQIKQALMLLDADDEESRQRGLTQLRDIAYDQSADHHDYALFYLGKYYWINGNIEHARDAWQLLVDQQKDERMAPSPWADVVKEKLSLISVE